LIYQNDFSLGDFFTSSFGDNGSEIIDLVKSPNDIARSVWLDVGEFVELGEIVLDFRDVGIFALGTKIRESIGIVSRTGSQKNRRGSGRGKGKTN